MIKGDDNNQQVVLSYPAWSSLVVPLMEPPKSLLPRTDPPTKPPSPAGSPDAGSPRAQFGRSGSSTIAGEMWCVRVCCIL